jgi:hypothetical protein
MTRVSSEARDWWCLQTVTIAREGRGECDARGSKGERKVKGEDLKSREECSRERMRAKSNWRCKHDEPVELVGV